MPEPGLRTRRFESGEVAAAALRQREHDVAEEALERRRLVALADVDAAARKFDRFCGAAGRKQAAREPVFGPSESG